MPRISNKSAKRSHQKSTDDIEVDLFCSLSHMDSLKTNSSFLPIALVFQVHLTVTAIFILLCYTVGLPLLHFCLVLEDFLTFEAVISVSSGLFPYFLE